MAKRLVLVVGSLLLFFASNTVTVAGFEFKDFTYSAVNENGSPAAQAGSHPWELTTSFDLDGKIDEAGEVVPAGDVKDIEVSPPVGLIGDPTATSRCSIQQFTTPPDKEAGNLPVGSSYEFSGATCPNDSQVGVAALSLSGGGQERSYLGVYNLLPPPGVPAEFGFDYLGAPVLLTASLRHDGSYGLAVHARDVSQTLHVFGAAVTLWGVPGAVGHDGQRGECLGREGQAVPVEGGCSSGMAPTPFLTFPTSCPAEPPAMSIRADPWQEPGVFIGVSGSNQDAHGNPVGITGCRTSRFQPDALDPSPDRGRRLPDWLGSRPESTPERKPERPCRGELARRGSDAAPRSGCEPLGCRWARSMHARTD